MDPTPYSGDFASPEQMIPPAGIRDEAGNPIPWESCITLNNNWGYAAHDHHYKSAKMVIHMLVECVSKGGNLLHFGIVRQQPHLLDFSRHVLQADGPRLLFHHMGVEHIAPAGEAPHSIQPDVIIDNRLEGSGENAGSIRTLDPTPYSGDFASPDGCPPPGKPPGIPAPGPARRGHWWT